MRAVVRRALVTGHAGFLGRHFVRRLLADGWAVYGVDIANGPGEDCRKLFATSDERYDLAVHCAAVVGGRQTIEGEPMAVATDFSIDSDYFQWCLRTRPRRAVYFSSSAAYPVDLQAEGSRHRLTEADIDLSAPRLPDAVYGWCKLTGEMQAQLVRAEGVPITVLRPLSGYGQDQDPTYPFRAFIDRALARSDPFEVWGDGQQVRDFIHVEDVVAGTLAAVEADVDVVNLCSGVPTSFVDLAELVCASARYVPELAFELGAPQGVRYRVGDPTLMRTFYKPKVTLEEGVARSLAARLAPTSSARPSADTTPGTSPWPSC